MISLDPALRFGARPRQGADALADQVERLLKTRPGTLPWKPEYGCDLVGLLGRAGAATLTTEASFRVEQALRRWMPKVKVRRCHVRLSGGAGGHGPAPTAETALTRGGIEAGLDIEIELETPDGRLMVAAVVRR